MENVNVKELANSCEELISLINESCDVLDEKPSDDLLKYLQIYLFLGPGIGGAIIGADIVKKIIANKKAKDTLLELYKELTSKHNMIIEEQSRIIAELSKIINKNGEEYRRLQKKNEDLKDLLSRINQYMKKVEQ